MKDIIFSYYCDDIKYYRKGVNFQIEKKRINRIEYKESKGGYTAIAFTGSKQIIRVHNQMRILNL